MSVSRRGFLAAILAVPAAVRAAGAAEPVTPRPLLFHTEQTLKGHTQLTRATSPPEETYEVFRSRKEAFVRELERSIERRRRIWDEFFGASS